MNHDEFQEIFDRQIRQCETVLLKKSEEYATDDDKLHNFKVASALTGETAEQALWGFCVKHLVSISDMVAAGHAKQFTTEQWDEKIGDAINYLILLRAQVLETEMDRASQDTVNLDSMPALNDLVKLNTTQRS